MDSTQKFLKKKSLLEHRLEEFLKDGVAYIPCYAGGIEDIISKFSTRRCVSLDSEFTDYVVSSLQCVPTKYPVVLEIHGPRFTDAEKKIIVDTITAEGDSALGLSIQENKQHRVYFWGMAIGTVVSGVLLAVLGKLLDDIPQEFFYVLFWLFADSLVRYIFIEREDYREQRIGAGRIASLKVEFVEDEDGFLRQ